MSTTKGPFGFTDDDVEPTAEELDAVADRAAKRAARLEQVARELEKAIKDLARWDRFTKENAGSDAVWEQVQRRRKEDLERKTQLEQEFKTLFDGDKNLPMVRPTLASTLDEIVGQLPVGKAPATRPSFFVRSNASVRAGAHGIRSEPD
jgi:hypothetical protein